MCWLQQLLLPAALVCACTSGSSGQLDRMQGAPDPASADADAGAQPTEARDSGRKRDAAPPTSVDADTKGNPGAELVPECSDDGQQQSVSRFVHPGGLHKQSDLDRMRLMVAAGVQPYSSAFEKLLADEHASLDYAIAGDSSQTVLQRDGINASAFESDATAAYLNALAWAVTGDERHAQKSVDILNAWSHLTEVTGGGTEALNAGLYAWKLVEAAELIKSTYSGWAADDITTFSEMLVYPGYSNTSAPPDLSPNNGTFYWRIYQGDSGRHGNQDLIAWRAMISMGVFLDNRIMFDRALNYFKGLPHREDDMPYAAGPPAVGTQIEDNQYFTTFQVGARADTQPDYGYNGVLQHYVWQSGQNQESSRDQQHALFGLATCAGIAEVAWNQGDGVFNALDHRLLLGFEHAARYNVSFVRSYPDQSEPWEPTGADFIQQLDRTGRWFSKQINPYFETDFERVSRGDFSSDKRPVFEQALAHYRIRMGLSEEQTRWTERGRDLSIELGGYEGRGWSLDHAGWGALTFRRPTWAAGDPIVGFQDGLPIYRVPELPGVIQAVHYDHFPVRGQSHTYHDTSPGNSGGQYRLDDVDITCGPGGQYLVDDIADGEWLSYTIHIPIAAEYPISVRYSAMGAGASVRVAAAGTEVIEEVTLASSEGAMATLRLGTAPLSAGVQTVRVLFSGDPSGVLFSELEIGDTP